MGVSGAAAFNFGSGKVDPVTKAMKAEQALIQPPNLAL